MARLLNSMEYILIRFCLNMKNKKQRIKSLGAHIKNAVTELLNNKIVKPNKQMFTMRPLYKPKKLQQALENCGQS